MPDVNYMKQLAEQFEKGELKILGDEEHFEFACDQCGKCCRNRSDIILNPLDIFHLTLATGKTCKEVVDKYGECYLGPSSHLPLVRLRYREELDGQTTCYFLGRRDGKFFCRVHEHKPGVCRTYPLGKITAAAKDGGDPLLAPSFFLQEEDGTYCAGLKRAHAEHINQKVIDWVGGPERKRVSNIYGDIFSEFTKAYGKLFDKHKRFKRMDKVSQSVLVGALGKMLYLEYDDCKTDDEFLERFRFMMELAKEMCQQVQQDPKYIIKLMQKAG